MSALVDTEQVIISQNEKQNDFLFNNVNIYDLFVFTVYPEYYKMLNIGEYEKNVIKNILGQLVEKSNNNFKITDKVYEGLLKTFGKEKFINSPDTINVNKIIDNLGARKTINMMKKAMTSTLKVGEMDNNEKLKETGGIKNKTNYEKYQCIYKMNIKLAVFILSLVQDLYWDEFTVNEESPYVHNSKSAYTLNECFDEIIKVAKDLMNVFNDIVEIKFPTSVSMKPLNYEFSKHKLEAETNLNNNLKPDKKKSKSKKSKKHKEEK